MFSEIFDGVLVSLRGNGVFVLENSGVEGEEGEEGGWVCLYVSMLGTESLPIYSFSITLFFALSFLKLSFRSYFHAQRSPFRPSDLLGLCIFLASPASQFTVHLSYTVQIRPIQHESQHTPNTNQS